jgi:hypothetical protein
VPALAGASVRGLRQNARMKFFALLMVSVAMMACGKASEPTKSAPKADPPDLTFVGEPVKQAADFPKERWVHTVLFDGKTPYIGFTYIDPQKGNCIKGEEIAGLSHDQIKARLHEKFPSSSMEPIPEGHPMTLLTPAEIKDYDLPAAPEWLSFYKH